MSGLKQKILILQQRKGCAGLASAILLPLVLYSFIQIALNLLNNSDHNDHHHQQHDDYTQQASHFKHHHLQNDIAIKIATNYNIYLKDLNLLFLNQEQHQKTTRCTTYHDESNAKILCSSTKKISTLPSAKTTTTSTKPLLSYSSSTSSLKLLSSSAYNYLSTLLQVFNQKNNGRTIFGGKILMASATSLYQQQQQLDHATNNSKGIIISLNSTNFNTELIQYKHPFPHIKLIEYYVAYCGFCVRFKGNYTKLAAEIRSWQNVIRPSAIDLANPLNYPIGRAWNVKEVPILRVYPPPNQSLAETFDKHLTTWNLSLSQADLQQSMFEEFNSSEPMLHSISLGPYRDKPCPECLIKSELLRYIERYVRQKPFSELPNTWPNLLPVNEPTLVELRQNHPRQELFLIIEGPTIAASDSDQSLSTLPSLGLNIILELSSSAAWKTVRYVRASENKPLLEDVIAQQKKINEQASNQVSNEQLELLQNFISNQQIGGNNIVLVHIDGSHSPVKTVGTSSVFPLVNIVTGTDLITMERSVLNGGGGSYDIRAKRAATTSQDNKLRHGSSFSSAFSEMSTERIVELFTLFIKQTYTETSEDRDFVNAINKFTDEGSKIEETQDSTRLLDKSNRSQSGSNDYVSSPTQKSPDSNSSPQRDQTFMDKIKNIFNSDKKQKSRMFFGDYSSSSDYNDKLKAIRYMLFNEIPRLSTIDKSLVEQQEKLNTLVNLVTVIKSYFPFADSSSIQFIDGVQSYLLKQQSRLFSVKTQESGIVVGFETRLFKQELKRLEAEGKRLPEIKHWQHCTGYPCGLWRLFHTLAAFEYKKLSQLRQPPSLLQQPSSTGLTRTDNNNNSSSNMNNNNNNNLSSSIAEAITMKSTNSIGFSSPVERLVSPPSTTTSLSLTIATPNSSQTYLDGSTKDTAISNNNDNNNYNFFNKPPLTEADLPMPVLLVMRDYITTFFSCLECANSFRTEAKDLSLERIRQQEPAEFSILWLWEIHNRVNKRLSVDLETNPPERPKVWFPSYNQCAKCYNKPPSFLPDTNVDAQTMFKESIEWNRQEILTFLLCEYTKQPLDGHINLFGNQGLFGVKFIIITCSLCVALIVLLRCIACYIERQQRHKATLLNGNGAHYSLELQ